MFRYNSSRRYDDYARRDSDRDRRDDDYDRRASRRYDNPHTGRYDRRDESYDDRRTYDRRSREKSHHDDDDYHHHQRRSSRRAYGSDEERKGAAVVKEEDEEADDDGSIDITKITPIMKYIAKNLEEASWPLALEGPFAFNTNSPGLSTHLFVAFKIVQLLEAAGYDQGKMYMHAMFPVGLDNTKKEILEKVNQGKLHPEIYAAKLSLVKMVVRCVRCFMAYFSGKKEDIHSDDDDAGHRGPVKETRTVNTSLSAVLGMLKEENTSGGLDVPAGGDSGGADYSDPLNRVLETEGAPRSQAFPDVPDSIANPWGAMDTKVKSSHFKSFTALQNHFQKQLMGKGLDPREAREESSDCMMCLVVTGKQ